MSTPPLHADVRRQIKTRLLELSPRAFELFAGDLLVYVGLDNVAVTRYVGDGGIDAYGEILTKSGLVRIPTGVQVKRHRQNVQRADIDRFIGALSGQYAQGIFITTAGYATTAVAKATSAFPRITPVNGDQVANLMLEHDFGLSHSAAHVEVDEGYFESFEQQAAKPVKHLHEGSERYEPAPPEDDLITLRALSYALRVDAGTIRGWIQQGKLVADGQAKTKIHDNYFFRRDRIEQIRRDFGRAPVPATAPEWRQAFLDFARSRQLTQSYKPVMLKALLKLVDRNGEVELDALVNEFLAFYLERERNGLAVEFNAPLLMSPASANIAAIKRLVVKHPLERFLIKGFLEYVREQEIVRFAPQLWHELRVYELLDLLKSLEEQIEYYYRRRH